MCGQARDFSSNCRASSQKVARFRRTRASRRRSQQFPEAKQTSSFRKVLNMSSSVAAISGIPKAVIIVVNATRFWHLRVRWLRYGKDSYPGSQ